MQDVTRTPDADGEQDSPSGGDRPGVPETQDDLPAGTPPDPGAAIPTDPGGTAVPWPAEVEVLLRADGGVPAGGATWLSSPLADPAEASTTAPDPSGEETEALAAQAVALAQASTPADETPLGRHLDLPNEAVPAVAPQEGTDAVGTIPQVSLRKRWARAQLSNWRLYLVRFLIAGLAVVAAVAIVPGVWFTSWEWGQFTRVAIIFGLLNATVKPLLQFLSLRFIFNTYGIVVVVINTLLLLLLSMVMDDVLKARSAFAALLAGAAVGVFGLLFETLLGANPPVLDRDYKERNGLK